MKQFISPYIEYHKTAWSPATVKTELSRLNNVAHLLEGGPEAVYNALQGQGKKPYTIKTTLTRVVQFEGWCRLQGLIKATPYADFMKRHRNKLKHAYVREDVSMTYDEAWNKIALMPSPYREAAWTILDNGLRISELSTIRDGHVTGKGGKRRKIYGRIFGGTDVSVSTLSAQLKAVSLKAHTLRKLCATRVAMRGAPAADLCKIFGWSSIATAFYYLAPKSDQELKTKFFE